MVLSLRILIFSHFFTFGGTGKKEIKQESVLINHTY